VERREGGNQTAFDGITVLTDTARFRNPELDAGEADVGRIRMGGDIDRVVENLDAGRPEGRIDSGGFLQRTRDGDNLFGIGESSKVADDFARL